MKSEVVVGDSDNNVPVAVRDGHGKTKELKKLYFV